LTPERDAEIERICHAALDRDVSARPAFLADACAGDEALRGEVESLLRHQSRADKFLDGTALDAAVLELTSTPHSFVTGQQLGPYQIQGLIGAGGMGDVYRALDTRLGRIVAIKVLSPYLHDEPGFQQRFDREAKTLATLSHPHICPVFDVGRQDGRDFLVMEYLEGATLAARLEKGALPINDALQMAMQIASALDAAHRAGIVHRDLKPGNVMLTKASARLFDFGLAKASRPIVTGAGLSRLATKSPGLTVQGTIVGTLQYMTPEQLEGHEADARTDIFAFGAVLYEMLTGRKAFEGKSQASLVAAILEREPAPLATLQPLAPPALARVVKQCLAKDPEDRWQSARDLRAELAWIGETGYQGMTPAVVPKVDIGRGRGRERLAWMAALVSVTLVAAVMTWRSFRPAPSSPELPVVSFDVQTPPTDDPLSFALSPDGRQLAFVANDEAGNAQLWIRPLDTTAARRLAGTEGASAPFWAPDSQTIGFFADRKLKRIDLAGGALQELADAPTGRGGTWNRDGVILFAPTTSGLAQVRGTGGPVTSVIESIRGKRGLGLRWPQFLPDGHSFLFYTSAAGPDLRGIYLGNLDGREPTRLMRAEAVGAFAAPGSLLVSRQDVLFALPFDPVHATVRDDPVRVAEHVVSDPVGGSRTFSVSSTGLLASRNGRSAQGRQLVWADRSGHTLTTVGPPDYGSSAYPELAPDGGRVAVQRNLRGTSSLWLIDLARGVGSAGTLGESSTVSPVWSPDSRRIVFASNKNGAYDLFEKPADGGGDEQPLLVTPSEKRPLSYSLDGRFVLFSVVVAQTDRDLWALPMMGDPKPQAFPVVHTSFDEDEGQISPDGRWLAYGSTESGRHEVYVQPFPGPGKKQRASTTGGGQVRWRPDGRELYYVAADNWLMAVPVTAAKDGRTLELGAPVRLFLTRFATGLNVTGRKPQYAVAGDGRFLLNVRIAEDAASPITIVQNWMAGIRK
jgi:serine/threonine protein kinase